MKKGQFEKFKIDRSKAEQLRNDAGEAIKNKSPKFKKILLIAAVAVVLLSLVLISLKAFTGMTVGDVTKKASSSLEKAGSGNGYPYVAEDGKYTASAAVGSYLGVVLDKKLIYLDSTAKEVFSYENNYTNPHLVSNNGNTLFYDIDTVNGIVTDGDEIVYTEEEIKKNLAERILIGDISKNGYMAFATRCNEGAAKVSVFNQYFEKKFHYIFKNERIAAMSVSDNGKNVCVATFNSENTLAISRIVAFDISSSKPVSDLKVTGNVAEVSFITGREVKVLTMQNSFVYDIKTGKVSDEKDFSSSQLVSRDSDRESKKSAVAVSDYGGKKCTVFGFKDNGREKFAVDVDSVRKISKSEKYTAVLTDGKIICLNNSGKVKCEMELPYNVDDIRLISNKLYIISGENIRRVRVSGRAKFPVDK